MVKKKLTITDLIAKKEQLASKREKKTTQELYIEEIDATITIEAPDRALVLDTLELAEGGESDGNADDYIVYNIVIEPNLKDAELQKEFGCTEPTDIVSKIFSIGTITGIAKAGMALAGYNDRVTPVDKLKN